MKKNEVIELAQWFSVSSLSRFVWKEENSLLELEKPLEQFSIAQPIRTEEDNKETVYSKEKEHEEKVKENEFILRAPVVGTFYASPAPGENPFVTVGQKVSKGQILCIVEAMKLLNEITSPVDGTIKEICAENEGMVEFDQKMMLIEVD